MSNRTKLPKAFSKYGADMGRRSTHDDANKLHAFKFRLERLTLDSGDYDNGGAYWGTGLPLYMVRADEDSVPSDSEGVEFYVRAIDRRTAKALVRKRYPNGRFFQ